MKRSVLLSLLAVPALADVSVVKEQNKVRVEIGGRPFTTLYYGPDTLKPYLHPLRAADGTIVTRQYPMEQVEGETKDHPHHQGVWFSHGNVNGMDFWEHAKPGSNHARIVVDKITAASGGKQTGTVAFEARWLAADGKPVLKESRTMRFHDLGSSRAVDFDIALSALDAPAKFGDTKEGTFAVRIADALTENSKGGKMVNAEGSAGMENVWGKASPWVDYSGKISGKDIGITIFDHPENPKHPTYWHARDYGLFAANIFGEHDFYRDKTRDGSVTLEAGKTMRFRYRVLIHPGDTASAKLAEQYEAFKRGKQPGS